MIKTLNAETLSFFPRFMGEGAQSAGEGITVNHIIPITNITAPAAASRTPAAASRAVKDLKL